MSHETQLRLTALEKEIKRLNKVIDGMQENMGLMITNIEDIVEVLSGVKK